MSAGANDNRHQMPDLGSLYLNKDTAGRLTMGFGAAGLVGLGLCAAGFFLGEESRTQALHSYLTAFMFVATLAVGGLFFTILQHLVGAYWSVTVRRISEAMSGTLPVVVLMFLPIAVAVLMGNSTLFVWNNHDLHNPAVQAKAGYLNVPFFMVRALVYLVSWALLGWHYYRKSLELDRTGDPYILLGLRKLSAPATLIFAWTLTFAGFDWLMSLAPTWYSTIFGVCIFAGTVTSSLSLMVIIALLLRRAGYLRDVITAEHYHDLGKLLFGFIVFWAYVNFSQFFLIWYANIPEETEWFAQRWEGTWTVITLLIIFGHFVVPFFMTLSRWAKRNMTMMALSTTLMVVMHYVDLHWIVMPNLHHEGVAPSWLDAAALLGTVGVFAAVLCRRLGQAALVPVKDPLLPASVEFENV